MPRKSLSPGTSRPAAAKNPFSIVDGEVQVDVTVEQLEQVLTLYDQMFDTSVPFPAVDPNMRGTGWPVDDPGFVEGKRAMAPMGPWLWGRRADSELAKDILDNKTAVTSLPVAEGGIPATYLEVKPIMLNSHSANMDAAWELIKFITSKEEMAQWLVDSGGIPARTDSLELPEFVDSEIGWWLQGFANELDTSVALAPVNWGPVNEANMRAVNAVIYDEQTPAEAAQWLFDQMQQLKANGEL